MAAVGQGAELFRPFTRRLAFGAISLGTACKRLSFALLVKVLVEVFLYVFPRAQFHCFNSSAAFALQMMEL